MIEPVRFALGLSMVAFFAAAVARAHHGPASAPLFDMNVVELKGEVTELFWRNPHVRFRFRVSGGEIWEVESGPVTWLARLGWTSDIVSIGDQVMVAGYVSTRRPNEMALTNMRLPNGQEFTGSSRPRPLRFSEERVEIMRQEIDEERVQSAISEADGIFRVWAWGVGEFGGGGMPDNDESMLTEQALIARQAFDLLTDEPVLDCVQDGMPRAMFHPSVIQFIDRGSEIEFRSHEHDIRRTIDMSANADPASVTPSSLGYSVGRWDGATLVVTTTRLNWHLSDEVGTPQSPDVVLTERFTPSADGSQLDYELTSVDPVNLTGSSVRTAHWMWVPGLEVAPYECEIWDSVVG